MEGDLQAYREGKERIETILKAPAMSQWHGSSRRLLNLWRLRVEPLSRLAELGDELVKPSHELVNQSVIDLLYLVNHRQYGNDKSWTDEELGQAETGSELPAWLLAMSEHPPKDAAIHEMEWWRKTHNSAWLIAALMNCPEQDDSELLAAARQVQAGSSEFESVNYYSAGTGSGTQAGGEAMGGTRPGSEASLINT
jgi:hypothetical protein